MKVKLPVSVRDFEDYFDLTPDAGALAAALDYTWEKTEQPLPQGVTPDWAHALQERMTALLPKVQVFSETARREIYIAPIFFEIAARFPLQLRIEHPITVNEQLRGSLDYYVEAAGNLLVVEAKRDDTDRGLTQLVAEMTAVDQYFAGTETEPPFLYGAISTGALWQFLRLNRNTKLFQLNVEQYLVPKELQTVVSILLGILKLA